MSLNIHIKIIKNIILYRGVHVRFFVLFALLSSFWIIVLLSYWVLIQFSVVSLVIWTSFDYWCRYHCLSFIAQSVCNRTSDSIWTCGWFSLFESWCLCLLFEGICSSSQLVIRPMWPPWESGFIGFTDEELHKLFVLLLIHCILVFSVLQPLNPTPLIVYSFQFPMLTELWSSNFSLHFQISLDDKLTCFGRIWRAIGDFGSFC